MRVYRIDSHDDEGMRFAATLAAVRSIVREAPPVFRAAVEVQELEVATHKAALIQVLNGGPPEGHVMREWRGTARGGLRLTRGS